MIVVKIEIWPFGNVTRARELGRVFISNTGTKTENGDNYLVRAEELGNPALGIPPLSDQFEIKEHDRRQTIFSLLGKAFSKFIDVKNTNS